MEVNGPKVSTYSLVISVLAPRERWTLAALVAGMVLAGMLEVLGLGLIFPYIALLQDPDKVMAMRYLSPLLAMAGLVTPRAVSVAISVGLLAVFCFKGVVAYHLINFQLRFIYSLQTRLGQEMLAAYLGRPYAFFLETNSSALISDVS